MISQFLQIYYVFYNKDHKGQHFCLDTGTALSSWYLAVDGYFFINADLWNRQSQNFQLFVMRFASEVGLCHNCVIELYITEFTSRNALVWKQLVSYLRLLAIRLWPSFLQKNNSRKHKLIYFRLIGICHFLGLLALSTSWLRMNDNHSCVHIISQVVTVTWTRKWLSDSANPSTSM